MALRDMGTLIMLASSRIANLALFWISLSAVVEALCCSIGAVSFPTTILILGVTIWMDGVFCKEWYEMLS